MTRPASSPPPNDRRPPVAPPAPPWWRHWLWPAALAAWIVLFLVLPTRGGSQSTTLTYSDFLADVQAKKISTITIDPSSGGANGDLAGGGSYTTVIPVQLAGPNLLNQLQAANVTITATPPTTSSGMQIFSIIVSLLPFLVLGYLWYRLSRNASGRLQGALGVGRSRAKVFDAERPTTTFTDVAGYEGAKRKIEETVDFLRNPERYRRAGAMSPRGVLMVGPPGTGKGHVRDHTCVIHRRPSRTPVRSQR